MPGEYAHLMQFIAETNVIESQRSKSLEAPKQKEDERKRQLNSGLPQKEVR